MTKSTKIEEDTSSINPDISSTFDETSGNGLEMRMIACNICKKEMRKDVLQQHLNVHKKTCRICKKMNYKIFIIEFGIFFLLVFFRICEKIEP